MAIPIILGILVTASAGFGVWGMLRHWKGLMETQLRLDRCVAEKAMNLKSTLSSLEQQNTAIEIARASVVAAQLIPGASEEAEAALAILIERQDATMQSWELARITWLARRGCGGMSDLPRALPAIPLTRLPPDVIGPNVLKWTEPPELARFQIQLGHRPRAAAAEVIKSDGEFQNTDHASNWQARWAVPLPAWTSLP